MISESTFSLKEIFMMSTQDLDKLIFCFCDDNNKLLSKIKKEFGSFEKFKEILRKISWSDRLTVGKNDYKYGGW